MTEDDARKKVCPWFLLNATYLMLNLREEDIDRAGKTSFCIASDCMMWRWEYDGDGQQCGWGYCGLAGKP